MMNDPTVETTAPDRARLSSDEIASLRRAGFWARLIAIVGFVFAILCGLGLGGFLAVGARSVKSAGVAALLISILAAVIFAALAAQQLLGYGRSVASFLAHREPALPRAFTGLRYFFWAYSVYVAFSAAMEVLMALHVL